ncbi:MAG: hypothetical protein IKW43_01835, partial [Bacteroidaceae bacterium]|nr:hypothetical protein [Bacteroidaceae bacterium]
SITLLICSKFTKKGDNAQVPNGQKRKAEKKSQPSIRLRVRRHFFSTIKMMHPLFLGTDFTD